MKLVVVNVILIFICSVYGNYDFAYDHKGRSCVSQCQRYDDYHYCYVKDGSKLDWGYCSNYKGTTTHNKACKSGHPCGQYGYPYYWCKTGDGYFEWDYCGLLDPRPGERWLDADGYICNDECDTRGYTYTWCHTSAKSGWGSCSKLHDVATNGKKCKQESPCDKYGEKYYYCYTQGGSWDYCGLIESCSTISTDDSRAKRAISSGERYRLLCHWGPIAFRFVQMFLRVQPTARFMPRPNNRLYTSALNLIEEFRGIQRAGSGTIYRNDDWRIDYQDEFNRGGYRWINLQIQRNGVFGISTVSQVLVRADVSFQVERIRDAFRRSLEEGNVVCLTESGNANDQCPLGPFK